MATYTADAPVLNSYHAVVSAYSDFLTVAIHTILYERNIYPPSSFIAARKFNCPVRQSRHPKVCKWIQDAVAAVEFEMLKCTLSNTSLVIHAPPPSSAPLERFLFSTTAFPSLPPSELLTPFSDNPPAAADLPEQFRATISRLSTLSSALSPLPPDCSFTLVTELRDDADIHPPLGPDTPWVAAEPSLQKQRKRNESEAKLASTRGNDLGGVRTTPIRSVESGAYIMEMWVEEGKSKFQE
ncbi:MAG: hypothetical protein Q9226_000575 [Calogaya cf. arnoldii]